MSEKEKNTIKAFIERIYEVIQPNATENKHFEEIIGTDCLHQSLKADMTFLLQELSTKFKNTCPWKYFTSAHRKGVVDGISENAKCLV